MHAENSWEHTETFASSLSDYVIDNVLATADGVNTSLTSITTVVTDEEKEIRKHNIGSEDSGTVTATPALPTRKTAAMTTTTTTRNAEILVDVKKEEAEDQVRICALLKKFTPEEDSFLKHGVQKYGNSRWSKILKDKEYKFAPLRTRDSL